MSVIQLLLPLTTLHPFPKQKSFKIILKYFRKFQKKKTKIKEKKISQKGKGKGRKISSHTFGNTFSITQSDKKNTKETRYKNVKNSK